jgi:hypothetical protein
MKRGTSWHRACRRSIGVSLAVFSVCAGCFVPKIQAQIVQDENGNVPAIRNPEAIETVIGNAWQQLQRRHLFDFSDSINTVVVDPVIQAHWGQTQGLEPDAIWDNIRGARFRARIDGMWYVGGELLERQGVASPMLGHWAAQNMIPGWGRSKLGRDNGFNTAENAYYDVSRARGWCGWSNSTWFVDAGIDALHIGAGNSSAFLSLEAAPAPYVRVAHETGNHLSSIWLTRWIGTIRGPLGETAESLLNRSSALFAVQSWQLHPRLLLQGVYSFVREKEASKALGIWEGWEEGDSYHAQRHWGGLELQFTGPLEASLPWIAYLQSAVELLPRLGQTDPVLNNRNALTHLAGAKLGGKTFAIQLEYVTKAATHCRDCFGSRGPDGSGAFESVGPARALLENGGISVQSSWNESLRLDAIWNPWNLISFKIHAEANEHFSWITPEMNRTIQTAWPLDAFVAFTVGLMDSTPEAPSFAFWQIGVRSGLLSY